MSRVVSRTPELLFAAGVLHLASSAKSTITSVAPVPMRYFPTPSPTAIAPKSCQLDVFDVLVHQLQDLTGAFLKRIFAVRVSFEEGYQPHKNRFVRRFIGKLFGSRT